MPVEAAEKQAILDEEHLKLLVLAHYVRAGTCLFFGFIPLIYVVIGIFMMAIPGSHKSNEPSPALIGGLFAGVGMLIAFFIWLIAFLDFLAGRFIAKRQHHTFCLVIAGFNCLSIPYGTLIGIFTILVMLRPTVRPLFERPPAG